MEPIDPKPPTDIFEEGLDARGAAKCAGDNPYCAGTDKRAEWDAGFKATLETEDDFDSPLDPNDGAKVQKRGL